MRSNLLDKPYTKLGLFDRLRSTLFAPNFRFVIVSLATTLTKKLEGNEFLQHFYLLILFNACTTGRAIAGTTRAVTAFQPGR